MVQRSWTGLANLSNEVYDVSEIKNIHTNNPWNIKGVPPPPITCVCTSDSHGQMKTWLLKLTASWTKSPNRNAELVIIG